MKRPRPLQAIGNWLTDGIGEPDQVRGSRDVDSLGLNDLPDSRFKPASGEQQHALPPQVRELGQIGLQDGPVLTPKDQTHDQHRDAA